MRTLWDWIVVLGIGCAIILSAAWHGGEDGPRD